MFEQPKGRSLLVMLQYRKNNTHEHDWDLCLYRPQRSCGQGNIFTPVCHSVHRGGLSACWDATPRDYVPPGTTYPRDYIPPGTTYPPGLGTPLGLQTPRTMYPPDYVPPPGSRLQHTVYERLVRILLECILVVDIFTKVNLKKRMIFLIKCSKFSLFSRNCKKGNFFFTTNKSVRSVRSDRSRS